MEVIDLTAAKAALAAPHVIDLRDDGFTIKHPLSCRPDLFECKVWAAASAALAEPPPFRGRYQCEIADDGMFTIGDVAERNLDDIDVAALVDLLERMQQAGDQLRGCFDELLYFARAGADLGDDDAPTEVNRLASQIKRLLGVIQSPPAPDPGR